MDKNCIEFGFSVQIRILNRILIYRFAKKIKKLIFYSKSLNSFKQYNCFLKSFEMFNHLHKQGMNLKKKLQEMELFEKLLQLFNFV